MGGFAVPGSLARRHVRLVGTRGRDRVPHDAPERSSRRGWSRSGRRRRGSGRVDPSETVLHGRMRRPRQDLGMEVSRVASSLLSLRDPFFSRIHIACSSEQTKEWAPDPVEHVLQAHTDWVRDVAWAPSVGVGKAYLASAGQVSTHLETAYSGIRRLTVSLFTSRQDKSVYIWTQPDSQSTWSRAALEPSSQQQTNQQQQQHQQQPAPADGKFGDVVWRVSWSVAGNVLAVSSGASPSLFLCVDIRIVPAHLERLHRRRQSEPVEGEPQGQV